MVAETAATPAFRMEPLATLPVFFKLQGRRVVMAGGDAPAVWKAELLAASGAQVSVFAEQPCQAMKVLAASPPDGSVVLVPRLWSCDDFAGAALAIGAVEGDDEAEAFAKAAREAGVPVNVVDKPAYCDFQFGTVVARSPLVIGISTDGAAPVFGQAVRTRIEAILPQALRAWARAAKDWRPALQAKNLDFRLRRRFWEAFTARAFDAAARSPTDADKEACFAAVAETAAPARGRLVLVGCGDGRPGSMVLDAVAALQSADLVVYEPDVPPVVIGLARREAPKLVADEAVVAMSRTWISEGKHIAWLGLGEPRDQAWAVRRNQLAVIGDLDIIPGVTL